jgi:putative cell wall-binding protein
VLLTNPVTLSTATANALAQLRPGRIVVVGGPNVVSNAVLAQLDQYTTGAVVRIAGANRFETAAALSRSRFSAATTTVFVATGRNFADALSAAPAAGAANAPLLLVEPTRVPGATSVELARLTPTRIVVLGGLNAVSSAVATQLAAIAPVQRLAGADRYGTSAAVAAQRFPSAVGTVFLATGATFPDALAAGAAAAALGAPVLLVAPTCIGAEVGLQIDRLAPANAVVLGGNNALAPAVAQLTPCPATIRYLGEGPLAAIRAQANAVAAQYQAGGCSTINGDRLAAMMISPIFKESGAATTPATAPSPMTLSRYDEWNGVRNAPTNASGNLGLYAFNEPTTPYLRAYWHPGIGMWQYDSAGVGAPFTAIERMDVDIVGADVARGMAGRYCAAPGIDGQPPTEQERRDRAWQPWWSPGQRCPLCQREYAALLLPSPLSIVRSVAGISTTGGAIARTCRPAGATTTVPCWYVNPTPGVVQGNDWWARLDPLGGISATVAPTPLSFPFYVLERAGREERHWLRADTGYAIDISASRLLGQNARLRVDQPSSGLNWLGQSGLCDVTANRGSCAPALVLEPESTAPTESTATGSTATGSTATPATTVATADTTPTTTTPTSVSPGSAAGP